MKIFRLLFFYYFIFTGALGQEVSLLFFGDIMGHDGQIKSAWQPHNQQYNYSDNFKYLKPYFKSTDLVFGNLEVTLAGPPYKGYPHFSSPDQLASALKNAGVNVLVTANNHSCDRGQKGLERTIRVLDSLGIIRTGTFLNEADKEKHHPKIIEKNGIRLALMNYTYGTNGIPATPPNIVNRLDKNKMANDLKRAKSLNVDKTILFLHWGNEYETTPSKQQTELTEFLFENGADIIIGSHPHVVQPMHLTYNQKGEDRLVVYSLGNFISNQRWELTDGGAMVRVVLRKHKSDTYIKNVQHTLTWVHRPTINNQWKYYILPASNYDLKGVPDSIPKGYDAMFEYLKNARKIMQQNSYVNEGKKLW